MKYQIIKHKNQSIKLLNIKIMKYQIKHKTHDSKYQN